MRNLILGVLVSLACACAHSSAEYTAAKSARYTPPADTLFGEVQAAVEAADYQVGQASASDGMIVTVEKWFNPEGAEESSGAGDHVVANDKGIRLQMMVKVVADGEELRVEVTPITHRVRSGQTNLEEIRPDDASMPGFVTGRVESLHVAIHKRLQGRAVAPPAP